MKHLIIVIIALLTLTGSNQEEVNTLKALLQAEQQKSEKLEKEFDELKNGTSEKIIAEKKAAEEKAKLAESKRKEADTAKAMQNLTTSHDKVNQVTWYKYKYASLADTRISAYIGYREGRKPWLRQDLFYKSDSWLFVRSYIFLIDGERIDMPPTKFERDNGSGKIWEWEDKMATETDIAILKKIINSKETIIRFNGDKYYDDHTVTSSEKAGLKDVLTGYQALLATQ
ncbi:hypothetical protein [Cellvibrio polysaccharolyticus]|uniref:Uncharacterized protein n=1 Tax=Cellvibrio polysaccharolyticus TaxID=2082724 RepID=A0A928V3G5_9GAMM|nr:hypothetical protein [Cellvibrio polysaccharolyticus]MBE8717577.1 hypothetical protein [Cellvibrio polysaccharolyticus]